MSAELDLTALREIATMHEHYSRHRDMEIPSSTVLALLDRVGQLQRACDDLNQDVTHLVSTSARMQARPEAAEAKVAAGLVVADTAERTRQRVHHETIREALGGGA